MSRETLKILDRMNDEAEAKANLRAWEIHKAKAWLKTLACHASFHSKDPRTKVAAVVVRPDFSVVSMGYNGMPKGIPDVDGNWDPSVKYDLVRHAEENAFDFAGGQSTVGCYLVCNLFPCHRCAGQIAQRGITKVFHSASIRDDLKPHHALNIFDSNHIEVVHVPGIVQVVDPPVFGPAPWDK